MKKQLSLLLLLTLMLTLLLTACGGDNSDYDEPVGGDWHVWGMYDFVTVGADLKVAVGRAYDESNALVGYDIYADGESQGPHLGRILIADSGRGADEVNLDDALTYRDYTGDGAVDIGIPLKGGDMLWYICAADADGTPVFTFYQVQTAEPAQ